MPTIPAFLACVGSAACLALLAGCAATTQPGCSAAAPAYTQDIPAGPRIAVPVTIGTDRLTFMLDTGAETSFLTTQAADQLQLRDIGDRERREGLDGKLIMAGAAGTLLAYPVAVPHLHFANGNLTFGAFMVADIPLRPIGSEMPAGLIGADILANWAFEIDRPGGRLRLFDEDACAFRQATWSGPALSEPFVALETGEYSPLARFALTVDGHSFTAILDTGASTALSGSAAASIGANLDGDRRFTVTGIGGLREQARLHRFAHLTFDGHDFGAAEIAILPKLPENTDMLLGEDFLLRHRVFVSYRQHRIFVDPT